MKKIFTVLFILLLLNGCGKNTKVSDEIKDTLITQDIKTDKEKMLSMIQECIKDYNEGKIEEREEYLQTLIPKLPIGVDKLPEISSLEQLTEQNFNKNQTNAFFIGTYPLEKEYAMKITIYKPTTGSFWLNASIQFQINPEKVEKNNPLFINYKNELNRIFSLKYNILNWLYGIDINLGEEIENGYFRVISIGNTNIKTIDELKTKAEEVFLPEFLESNYYPTAFLNNDSIFKEINGILCSAASELTAPIQIQYNPDYIVNVKENKKTIDIDILYSILDQVQPDIRHLILYKSTNGLRLANDY